MRFLFHKRGVSQLLILLICVTFSLGKSHIEENDAFSGQEKEDISNFVTIRIPAHVTAHKEDCIYEGKVRRHGAAWSPGPCVPECRCKRGHVECSKIECPDLNCETSIKKKWKCCPECVPEMQNGTSCGVWTKGGNSNGSCCVFPFHYHGVTYYTCTYQDHDNPWCAVTPEFDRDGVWGECIDKGDSGNALRFIYHEEKTATNGILDKMNNFAKQAALNAVQKMKGQKPDANATQPTVSAGNVTQPIPAMPLFTFASAFTSVNAGNQPAATGIQQLTSPVSNTIIPVSSSHSTIVQPTSTSTQLSVTVEVTTSTVQPSIVIPTPGVPGPYPSPTPPSIGGILSQSSVTVEVTTSTAQPSIVIPTRVVPGPYPLPAPPPIGSILPQSSAAVAPTSQPVVLPGKPIVAPGKPAVECLPLPAVTNLPGGTPNLGPQPAPQPCPEPQPAQAPSQPFPISQTTIDPGQTQAPGQVVHEITTTEINPTHNISTTESWFGKANETLNRTNDATDQTSSTAARNDSLSNLSNSGLSNQALYGYQAASSPYTYQSQDQASYTDQQNDSEGYTSYNTPGYDAYYDIAAYQGNEASQAQNITQQSDSQAYTSSNTPEDNRYYDNTANQQDGAPQAKNTAQQSDSQAYTSSNTPEYNRYYDNTANQENGAPQAKNTAQQSDSQAYTSSNTPEYNRYYDNSAYQQDGASQAQSTPGRENYYSDTQQYQTPSNQGSYYSG